MKGEQNKMEKQQETANRIMINAKEAAQMLGCKPGLAYKIIRELNTDLKARGKITLRGKINRQYFLDKVNVE